MKTAHQIFGVIVIICVIIGLAYNFVLVDEESSDQEKENSSGPLSLKLNQPYQITNDPANQDQPAIYGNRIVWQDDRNGNWDIYMFDLSTGKERQITADTHDQVEPVIFGDIIVWKDTRNHDGIVENYPIDYNSDIYLFDLRSNKEEPLIINEFCQFSPNIYDQTIIWLDYRNGQADVYMYDLSTNVEKKISSNIGNCSSSSVYGDYIVWQSTESDSIFKYNISTGQIMEIDQIKANTINALNFFDDYICWHSTPEKDINSDIFLYQISTDITIQITTNESFQYQPIISGNDIFWTDLRNDPDGWDCGCGGNDPSGAEDFDNWDIYRYDVNTGEVQQITSSDGSEIVYGIHSDKIVFIKKFQNRTDVIVLKFK